jgi:hypothetical protein
MATDNGLLDAKALLGIEISSGKWLAPHWPGTGY